MQVVRQFAAHRCFARALQTAHHNDGRQFGRNAQFACGRAKQSNQFFVDDFDYLLPRGKAFQNFLTDGAFRHFADEVLCNGVVDVGFKQSHAHFAHCLFDFQFGKRTFVAQLAEHVIYSVRKISECSHVVTP